MLKTLKSGEGQSSNEKAHSNSNSNSNKHNHKKKKKTTTAFAKTQQQQQRQRLQLVKGQLSKDETEDLGFTPMVNDRVRSFVQIRSKNLLEPVEREPYNSIELP